MVFAVIVLAFLGALMALRHFYQVTPDALNRPLTWAMLYAQADSMTSWPFTAAPLWWKLSFFIMGGLILLPRLLTIRD